MKLPNQKLDEEFTSNEILKTEIKELKAVYERSIATRDFEIQQLQNRNNYFIIFQGVMLSGVLTSSASKPFVEFLICLFCILFSMYQTNIAAGAKYWQEYWELKTSDFEGKLKQKFDQYMDIYKIELIGKLETQIEYLESMQIYEQKISKIHEEINKIKEGRYIFHHLFEFLDKENVEKVDFENKLKNRITAGELNFDSRKINSVNIFDLLTNSLILKKYSVSRVPVVVGTFFIFLWIGLFIHTVSVNSKFFTITGFVLEPNTHSIVESSKHDPIKIIISNDK